MSEHTPGPWRAINGSHIRTLDNISIASCHFSPREIPERVHSTTCEANARLIAAAPELVEALEGVLNVEFDYGHGRWAIDENSAANIVAARALLARIEGE